MLMADDSSSFWASPEFGGNDDDNLCMDYDQFISLIEQPNQSASDDSSLVEVLPNGLALDDIKHNDSQGESYASQVPDINNCDSFSKPGQESIGAPSGTCLYMDMLRGDMSYGNAAADSSLFQSHDYSFGGNVSSSLFGDTSWVDMPYGHGIFPLVNQELITDAKDEELRFPSNDPYLTTNGCSSKCEDSQMLPNGDYAAAVNDVAPEQPIWWTHPGYVGKKAAAFIKDEKYDSVFGNESFHSSGVTDGAFYAMSYVTEEKDFFTKDNVYDKVEKEAMANASKRARYSENMADGFTSTSSIHDGHLDLHISEQPFSYSQISTFGKKHLSGITSENSSTSILANATASHSLSFSPESSQSNSIDCRSRVDDDPDICIIEEMSHPAPSHQSIASGSSLVFHNEDPSNVSLYNSGVGATRLKINAEQLIYQVALQDLSQPKSEEIPPDGVLAVPLLRHQRIALSWMVKKETAINCCGGILADDQGLGKTVSTIALILKERPPSFRINQENENCGELQTLDLDGDENVEGDSDCKNVKLTREKLEVSSSGSKDRSACPLVRGGGRPAAGTLVVCPTSVLRQWEEELHNKVTSTARLSVLVYHGGNRTKDPHDLAKYDVVLTTYSIVSMEVPKQPLVDKDDDEGRKPGDRDLPPGILSGKRRKDAFSTSKKRVKDGKKMESELLESIAGPLAKVGWFRVILDEAQSIKNYRTQVARACWGLRAKRRWCLSGTPIQNAIDDLYSYFRFLRYDPFAVYKTFCSTIKGPIQRSPAKGYRKLQAILKTIMLRRTKGTLLDGEPIINLPPKSVELKKVEFSKEERDFYSRLEADSRAQFAEYAAAGTVKENYVNILLMLLRLRQACDHPLLVKGYDSSSRWQSSVEMAKKLPREKQIFLLNRLEASLAICGICNDPPEEAVVSICGHVFCNQCLCELLAGDDGHCPTTNCKVRLSMSMVFSKDSLNISLSDQPVLDGPHGCSHSDLVETVDSCSLGHMYDSSKISAALEVLQSLSKMQDCKERDSHAEDLSNLDLNYSDSSFSSPSRIVVKDNAAIEKRWTDSNKPPGEKAIVFSQWTRMLDLLEARLKDSSIQYRRLDGTMSVHARDKAVKDFNAIPEVSVMIMSLKAASLGLNMVSACHVLLLDLWWNPTTEDQAVDRAHRIGQTRPVRVLRLTVKDTVEDRILALQQKKRQMVASAFGEDEKGSRQTRLTVEDLKYLFMA